MSNRKLNFTDIKSENCFPNSVFELDAPLIKVNNFFVLTAPIKKSN